MKVNKPVIPEIAHVKVANPQRVFVTVWICRYTVVRLQQKSVVVPHELQKWKRKRCWNFILAFYIRHSSLFPCVYVLSIITFSILVSRSVPIWLSSKCKQEKWVFDPTWQPVDILQRQFVFIRRFCFCQPAHSSVSVVTSSSASLLAGLVLSQRNNKFWLSFFFIPFPLKHLFRSLRHFLFLFEDIFLSSSSTPPR